MGFPWIGMGFLAAKPGGGSLCPPIPLNGSVFGWMGTPEFSRETSISKREGPVKNGRWMNGFMCRAGSGVAWRITKFPKQVRRAYVLRIYWYSPMNSNFPPGLSKSYGKAGPILSGQSRGKFADESAETYHIHPNQAEDYSILFRALKNPAQFLSKIIHLWMLDDSHRGDLLRIRRQVGLFPDRNRH